MVLVKFYKVELLECNFRVVFMVHKKEKNSSKKRKEERRKRLKRSELSIPPPLFTFFIRILLTSVLRVMVKEAFNTSTL